MTFHVNLCEDSTFSAENMYPQLLKNPNVKEMIKDKKLILETVNKGGDLVVQIPEASAAKDEAEALEIIKEWVKNMASISFEARPEEIEVEIA